MENAVCFAIAQKCISSGTATPSSVKETIVTGHDESRRAFLVGTAAAAAGLAHNAQGQPAQAQPAQAQPAQTQTATTQHPAEHAPAGARLGAFLNADDSAALEALVE